MSSFNRQRWDFFQLELNFSLDLYPNVGCTNVVQTFSFRIRFEDEIPEMFLVPGYGETSGRRPGQSDWRVQLQHRTIATDTGHVQDEARQSSGGNSLVPSAARTRGFLSGQRDRRDRVFVFGRKRRTGSVRHKLGVMIHFFFFFFIVSILTISI